jgi:CheY-like chemotaxis protein
MPDGGTLRVTVQEVVLDESFVGRHPGAHAGRHVCVAMADTGTGMDEETRKRVFEPFFTTKPPGKGTGLGMAMVYGLTKQQDGFVEIATAVGRGTEVCLYFPAVTDPAQEPARPEPAGAVRGGHETILLVEDEEPLRRSATRVLAAFGYQVVTAEDGLAALEVFRAHQGRIDLVLSDVVMPRMSGPQLYEALRKENRIKFVLVSGYGAREAELRGVLDPSIPIVQKPWEMSHLLATVRRVLDG